MVFIINKTCIIVHAQLVQHMSIWTASSTIVCSHLYLYVIEKCTLTFRWLLVLWVAIYLIYCVDTCPFRLLIELFLSCLIDILNRYTYLSLKTVCWSLDNYLHCMVAAVFSYRHIHFHVSILYFSYLVLKTYYVRYTVILQKYLYAFWGNSNLLLSIINIIYKSKVTQCW